MTCDFCGEPLQFEEHCERAGLVDVKVSGGYSSTPGNGSGALDDRTVYKFSICEFCLDWMFTQFKIPPKMTELIGDGIEISADLFKSAIKRVAEDDWRKQKKKFYNEQTRRCVARTRK
jgi:hypothetical protein